ncbi:MAG: hypothetical protein Q8R00_00215 [Candidatus Nanoarchaeia archaeon]|nr:hypothetical protein [Candidatus Nanoarchaeia archaeon]
MHMNTIEVIVRLLLTSLLMVIPLTDNVSADVNFDTDKYVDEGAFNQILEPVLKIYSFGKYAASLVALLVLLVAGISYMTSGNDPRKRDSSKNMATYVFVGLIVIWVAPYAINFII